MQGKMEKNLSMFSRNTYFAAYLPSCLLTFSFYLCLQNIQKTNRERYLAKEKIATE